MLHELLVGVHVTRVYLYHEIIITAGIVALRYLVNILNGIDKLLYHLLGVLLKADVTHDHNPVSDFLGIDHGHITGNKALPFQTFLTLERR